MIWFFLALGSAFFWASADFLIKRHFSDLPLAQVVLVRMTPLVPFCFLLWWFCPPARVEPGFYLAVGAALPAEVVATFLYMQAIQLSPLALTQPFLAFTPLFAVFTGFFILGESPTALGLLGIGLLAAGAYSLNLHLARRSWAGPFLAVMREPGSWRMLVVGALYAYTGVLGRKAVGHSSAWFMASVYPLLWAGSLSLALLVTGRWGWLWLRRPWPLMGVGFCMAAMLLCHFWAISLIQAAYMLSIKRLSLLLAIVYGAWFLGEKRLFQHLLAGVFMVAGSAVILLWG
jgi:drug/metabolite transporter (DMT)-like permease